MFVENIKNEEVNSLECKTFDGEIVIVNTPDALAKAVQFLEMQQCIGFDTEGRPRFIKGSKRQISLLQFATIDKVFLVRIDILGLTKSIVNLFENSEIKKIGLGLTDDMHVLHRLKQFNQAGFIDLQQYSKQFGIIDNSLRKIVAITLGFRISKSQRLSNWESQEYTPAQKRYAATDAWVCLKIYQKLSQSIDNKGVHP